MSREFLTEQQLAEQLQVTPRTVTRWRHDGKIRPRIKVGQTIRYELDDVIQQLEAASEQAPALLPVPDQTAARRRRRREVA